ncbi:MAG: MOSC domain-containing protein [Amphiplicatus sp.]
MLNVGALCIYPLKGARGIALERAALEPRGFEHDRRWLAADGEGVFLTQREAPALARIEARPIADGLHLRTEGVGDVAVALDGPGPRGRVKLWRDEIDALAGGAAADAFLSAALGREARLFYMDDAARRATSARWSAAGPVSFADGYPLLLAATASLDALNAAIVESGGVPVGMDRFRPNLVIEGAAPWAEDRWRRLRIGDAEIELVKPCDRCIVTTTDQETGERRGREPLRTLNRLRLSAHPEVKGVLFGWNAVVRKAGVLSKGDEAGIVEARPEGWPLSPARAA